MISLDAFRAEALAYLEANAQRRPTRLRNEPFQWGQGSDRVALFADSEPGEERSEVERGRTWRRSVYDAGFGWLSGPPEYGGRGLPDAYHREYQDLERQFETPSLTPFSVGLGMVAPTLLAHGTEEAKQRWLRGLYRGDIIGCQLFSEPGAGSDLAGVSTAASRDGDVWVVSGQKVWTTGAHYCDIGLLLTRTANEPRHRNLTAFVVEFPSPGLSVRPLRQMTGGASFNEVFLDEVSIPDGHRLGDVNGGWRVAMTTLLNERGAVGAPGTGGSGILRHDRLVTLAHETGRADDPVVRQELARIYIALAVARYTRLRAESRRKAGQPPGPEMSVGKLSLTKNMTSIADLVTTLLGPRLGADAGEWGTFAWSEFLLGIPGLRIGGGTDEIQRNILAERVLGLPKDQV